MKEKSKLSIPTWREQGRAWKHSDVNTPNSKKKPQVTFHKKQIIRFIVSLLMCLQYFKSRISLW